MVLVRGFDSPASAWDQDSSWQLNITSTTFIGGDPEVGVTFMAPTSGRVFLVVGGGGRDNTGTNRVFMTTELYRGTQAVSENLVATSGGFVIPGEADESMYGSRSTVLVGLIPYEQYFARHGYRVSGGNTCDVFVREIVAVPLP